MEKITVKQIKLFANEDYEKLQSEVNEWLLDIPDDNVVNVDFYPDDDRSSNSFVCFAKVLYKEQSYV